MSKIPTKTEGAAEPEIAITRGVAKEAGRPLSPEAVVEACKMVFDPDVHVDVYNLGLIYKITPDGRGNVDVEMTLTSPTCPVAEELVSEVAEKISALEGAGEARVRLVWEPAWDLSMMSDEARYQLDVEDLEMFS